MESIIKAIEIVKRAAAEYWLVGESYLIERPIIPEDIGKHNWRWNKLASTEEVVVVGDRFIILTGLYGEKLAQVRVTSVGTIIAFLVNGVPLVNNFPVFKPHECFTLDKFGSMDNFALLGYTIEREGATVARQVRHSV